MKKSFSFISLASCAAVIFHFYFALFKYVGIESKIHVLYALGYMVIAMLGMLALRIDEMFNLMRTTKDEKAK